LGYKISFKELYKKTNGKHFGRPFIAELLIQKYPNQFSNKNEIFNKLLGKESKSFVLPKGTELKEVIEIIHKAGGIAIVAHPWYLGDEMFNLLKKFVYLKGNGVEIDCPKKEGIPKDLKKKLKNFAKENKLIISGGTDFHKIKEGRDEISDRGISMKEFLKLKIYYRKMQIMKR
jgi:hypothetical protein